MQLVQVTPEQQAADSEREQARAKVLSDKRQASIDQAREDRLARERARKRDRKPDRSNSQES